MYQYFNNFRAAGTDVDKIIASKIKTYTTVDEMIDFIFIIYKSGEGNEC